MTHTYLLTSLAGIHATIETCFDLQIQKSELKYELL